MSLYSLSDNMSEVSLAPSLRLQPFALRCLQITASLLDLPALADLLQQLPLHQRLDLEPELLQVRCRFRSRNLLHGSSCSDCLSIHVLLLLSVPPSAADRGGAAHVDLPAQTGSRQSP